MISTFKRQQQYSALLLLLFSIFMLSIIPLYRLFYYAGLPPGETVYSHMFFGKVIAEYGIPSVDPAIAFQRAYHFDLFDMLLGIFGQLIGMNIAALMLPFFLGLLTIFFCYRLFLLLLSPKQALLASVFLVSSPVFITIFSEATNMTLLLPILCGGFLFFFQKNWTKYLSFVFFGLVFFSGSIHIFLALLLLLCFSKSILVKNPSSDRKYMLLLFLFMLLLGSLSFRGIHIQVHSPQLFDIIQNFFSDLGGIFGFSVFTVVLTFLSIPALWRKKMLSPLLCFFFLVLFFLIFFISPLYVFYLVPFFALGALFGFEQLVRHQWKLEYLSRITLFLFILGILFSATSTVSKIAKDDPTPEIISAFSWLEQHSDENAIVYTSPSASSWVAYGSNRRVLLDKKSMGLNNTLLADNQILLSTRHIEEALSLFEKYNVEYVAVVHDLSDDSWSMNNANLLFLLENSPHFKLVFQNDRVEIWSVSYSSSINT